mgnify:CR=1 FL=1
MARDLGAGLCICVRVWPRRVLPKLASLQEVARARQKTVAQVVLRFVPELSSTTVWDEDAAIRYMARRDATASSLAQECCTTKLRCTAWGGALGAFLQHIFDLL